MASSHEAFHATVEGLEISYHGIDLDSRVELASEDSLIRESVEHFLKTRDKARYEADMIRLSPIICPKYSLMDEYFAMAWHTREAKLEAAGFAPIDADKEASRMVRRPTTVSELAAEQAADEVLRIVERIVSPYIYSGRAEDKEDVYRRAVAMCASYDITPEQIRRLVDSLIPDVDEEINDFGGKDFYDEQEPGKGTRDLGDLGE